MVRYAVRLFVLVCLTGLASGCLMDAEETVKVGLKHLTPDVGLAQPM